MRDLLPEIVFNAIRDRYLAGVADAEALFDQHSADEDSVTGALGQAISTRTPISFNTELGPMSLSISYKKIRGRGANSPERIYGADGIFQISLRDQQGKMVRSKGLPFQSKMRWRGKKKDLLTQVIMMQEKLGSGIVIDFSEAGYRACSAEAAIAAQGSRPVVNRENAIHPLGQILGNDFLECSIGIKGLYFDIESERFAIEQIASGIHIFTTEIISWESS